MDAHLKIVTQLPLLELWRNDGFTSRSRGGGLSQDEISSLLRMGKVQFVIADIGGHLKWIPMDQCYDFWKTEVQPRLAEPTTKVALEDFPENYCYLASEWGGNEEMRPIILIEKHH